MPTAERERSTHLHIQGAQTGNYVACAMHTQDKQDKHANIQTSTFKHTHTHIHLHMHILTHTHRYMHIHIYSHHPSNQPATHPRTHAFIYTLGPKERINELQ